MENHDKTGSEIHGLILFEKHSWDNAVHGMKETVKQGTVIQKKVPELFIDCKNAVAVTGIYQFKGHTGSAFHGIFIAAVYHFIDIFHLSFSGMEGIFNFFIVVNKDFL